MFFGSIGEEPTYILRLAAPKNWSLRTKGQQTSEYHKIRPRVLGHDFSSRFGCPTTQKIVSSVFVVDHPLRSTLTGSCRISSSWRLQLQTAVVRAILNRTSGSTFIISTGYFRVLGLLLEKVLLHCGEAVGCRRFKLSVPGRKEYTYPAGPEASQGGPRVESFRALASTKGASYSTDFIGRRYPHP